MFGSIPRGEIGLFLGKMGTGKTTNAASQIAEFHRMGVPIWLHNMEVTDYPKIKKGQEHAPILKLEKIEDLWGAGEGLFVIDEVLSTVLNSREWKDLPADIQKLMTHIRKLHLTGLLLAQSWQMVEINARRVSSYARKYDGSRLFGRLYHYTEHAIDDSGEILKGEEVEYHSVVRGFRIVWRHVYDLFDTDQLVDGMRKKIMYRSAVASDPNRTWTTPDEWLRRASTLQDTEEVSFVS